ncbi:MAG: ABC transporter permease subunit [Bacillus sp. (in: firmicutes)]
MKLIANEMMKIFRKTSTYIMLALLILIILGVSALYKYSDSTTKDIQEEADWKQTIEQQIAANEDMLKEPELDEFTEESIISDNAILQYRLDNDMAPSEKINAWVFLDEMALIIDFIAIITITLAAGIVANEFSAGTIKLLLIRPVTRLKILMSKYISVLLFSGFVIMLTFLLTFLAGAVLFGFEGSEPFLYYIGGEVVEQSPFVAAMLNYLLSSVGLFMLTTMAFMISSAFRNSSLAIGISLFLLLMGSNLTYLLSLKFDWAKYSLFANIHLNEFLIGNPFIAGTSMSFSVIMLTIYLVIFLFLSIIFFTKRDVAS